MLALTKELPFSEHSGAWGSWFSPSGGRERYQDATAPRKHLEDIVYSAGEGRPREGCLGPAAGQGRGRGMG